LKGKFVNRKLPSAPLTVDRFTALTGFVISTLAFATAAPDGSLTTPSIDPAFPVCPKTRAVHNKKLNTNIRDENCFDDIAIPLRPWPGRSSLLFKIAAKNTAVRRCLIGSATQ
jgi:hypothetical protein